MAAFLNLLFMTLHDVLFKYGFINAGLNFYEKETKNFKHCIVLKNTTVDLYAYALYTSDLVPEYSTGTIAITPQELEIFLSVLLRNHN